MLKKLAHVALLAFAACTAGPRKLDVEVHNRTPRPLYLRMRAAGLERKIALAPGASWSGWVPVVSWVKKVDVDVSEEP